jgi:hypothetical protein
MSLEEMVLSTVGTTWKKDVKRIQLAQTDKAWNRERTVKSYVRLLKSFAPELLDPEKPKKRILDIMTGPGIFMEVLRALGHEVEGFESMRSIYHGMHNSQSLKVVYQDLDKPSLPQVKKSFDYVFCIDKMNEFQTGWWKDLLGDMMRVAKKTVVVGFVYDGYFQVNGWEIRDWDLEFKLTKVDTNILRWDK